MSEYDYYILDIEGTVCPISFVKDELFPYFVKELPTIISKLDQQDGKIQEIVSQFPAQETREQLTEYVLALVRQDIKDPVLKQLQGHVWRNGYHNGSIKAPVYQDAIKFISDGKNKIFIYSSGSVQAQKLLFEYVRDPSDGHKTINLMPSIENYFDIDTSGMKIESTSYDNIYNAINIDTDKQRVLFLSDNPLEIDAATEAGISTRLVVKPGNVPVPDAETRYKVLYNFNNL